MLTGEPLPAERGPGASVTGGTVNGANALVVCVESIAAESVLSRMQRLVDDAQRDKPPLQRLADRIGAVFVPFVLLGAVATFLCWWLVGGNFGTAVLSAVAVLLVACPCAMGLAAPVAVMVGTGRASALGILIRSGDALERLARVDTAVFDKTGTLTERHAVLTAVVPASGVATEWLLGVAAAVESEVDHPIATAIRAAGPPVAGATEVEVAQGSGVSGIVEGHRITVGRFDGAVEAPSLRRAVEEASARGETVVYVSSERRLVGVLAVATPVRVEARGSIERLRAMGLTTMILSGDASPAVAVVADELAIARSVGALSPAQKLDELKGLQDRGHKVLMVGDGVNDAPALSAADVGCAVGGGSEAAVETADVALLGSDLHGVPDAIGVARATSAVIVQNFGWAMGYNLAALPLAAAGLLDPLVAALAMGLSSLLVVLNSLRLLRLGRSGHASIRPPRVLRGARGFLVSVVVPMALFATVVVVGQAFSPARGQPLIPTLPTIVTVSLPHGASAELYLQDTTPGANELHLFLTGLPASVPTPTATVTGPGAHGRRVAMQRLSVGHYIGYPFLTAGTWRFTLRVEDAGTDRSISASLAVS
jgi:Cu+-exporting ATPase